MLIYLYPLLQPIMYNDAVQLIITCVPEAPVSDGTVFSLNSVFSHYGNFGKQLITESAKRSDITISVPAVSITQVCSPLLGDAQDKISCTVEVSNSANLVRYVMIILLIINCTDKYLIAIIFRYRWQFL